MIISDAADTFLPGLYMKLFLIYILLFSGILSSARAHVGISYPTGNEFFTAGSIVTIEWYIAIDHGDCDWDLYFSTDNGNNWLVIEENLSKSRLSYEWIVPGLPTGFGKIRIIQDNATGYDYDAVSNRFSVSAATDVIFEDIQPDKFHLFNAYPNPFNSSTIISFNLPGEDFVKLRIFNVAGKEIETLINSVIPAGFHQLRWEAGKIPSGVYFYTLETRYGVISRKVILLK